MKKYIIGAALSIGVALFLIPQLYKNTDIDIGILDEIVETVAEKTGLGKTMVAKKKVEKAKIVEEKKLEEMKREEQAAKVEVPKIDSSLLVKEHPVEEKKEAPKKSLFNAVIDKDIIKKEEEKKLAALKADSIAKATAMVPEKPKRKLFNSAKTEEPVSTIKKETAPVDSRVFFHAKVNGSQKFQHDGEVVFRCAEPVKIGEKEVPANYIFRAKVNVFDERVHFVLKDFSKSGVSGENYVNNKPGIPLTADIRLKDGYMVSDGMPITFGVKN